MLALAAQGAVKLPDGCYVVCTDDDRDAWLAARRHFITGTAAPAIVGVSPWKTRQQLWHELVGEQPRRRRARSERMRWGLRLEPVVLEGFAEDHGTSVRRSGELVASERYPWAACTLDGWEMSGEELVPLEVKCVDARHAHLWDGGPPPVVRVQVQHQLMVTGLPRARVLAMVGGNELRVYEVERDASFLEWLAEEERTFWEAVHQRSPVAPVRAREVA